MLSGAAFEAYSHTLFSSFRAVRHGMAVLPTVEALLETQLKTMEQSGNERHHMPAATDQAFRRKAHDLFVYLQYYPQVPVREVYIDIH